MERFSDSDVQKFPIMVEFHRYQKSGEVAWVYAKYSNFFPEGSENQDTIKNVKYWLFVLKILPFLDNFLMF